MQKNLFKLGRSFMWCQMKRDNFLSGFFVMKRIESIIVLLFIASCAVAQMLPSVRLVQQTATFADIELVPSTVSSVRENPEGIRYSWFDCEYCQIRSDSAGVVHFYSVVPVVLPSEGTEVIVLESESTAEKMLAQPTEELAGILPRDDFSMEDIVSLRDVVNHGSYVFASLVVRAVEYRGHQNVRLLQKIRIRLSFEKAFTEKLSPLAFIDWREASKVLSLRTHALRKNLTTSSVLASGQWFKFGIQESGIYKLDYNYFKNQKNIPSSFWENINEIRIYGNGGIAVPQNMLQPYPGDLQEIARLVVDKNGNGVFENDDYILFYGRALREWNYTPTQKSLSHFIHPYAETNIYFLTSTPGVTGKTMVELSSLESAAFQPASFRDGVFVEEEKNKLIHSGRQWVGRRFDASTTSAVYTNLLPGIVSSEPILYRFLFFARSSTVDNITITENGQSLVSTTLPSMYVSASDNQGYFAIRKEFSVSTIRQLPDNRSVLKFQYSTTNSNAIAWLDWFEIQYERAFEAVNDYLQWWAYDTTADVRYEIKNLSSRDVFVFDITDHANVVRITNLQYEPADPSLCRFTLPHTKGTPRRFALVGPKGTKTPPAVESVQNSNLHGVSDRIDYIIISPSEFLEEAYRLRNHRETQDTLRTYVAPLEAVYNEFSGGIQDPFAIRNFLKYARENWIVAPQYVLLFGAGHYDYKNISSSIRNWVPPFETFESSYQIQSYSSDDSLVILVPGDARISMAVGRLPVRSVTEAKIAVDKIIRYETESPFSEWRNLITFVADDEFATRVVGDSASVAKEYFHAEDTESLARYYVPSTLEKKKIFLSMYPDVITASGRKKPAAAEALVNAVNEGTLILNYTGHGNETVWAHEEIFSQSTTLPQLKNRTKLFLLIAATCDFALYDDPSVLSAGEEIVTMEQGGAILGISASRPVYANQNIALNREIFKQLFLRDAQGNVPRIGDVLRLVKQTYYTVNDKKYHLFGDPTIRILLPKHRVTIDSLNSMPTSAPVAVQALGKVRTDGTVRNTDSTPLTSFTGEASLKIYGPTRAIRFNNWPAADSFLISGAMMYSGKATVVNGAFRATSRIPKDVLFGNKAKISVYASDGIKDAVGTTENVIIQGIDTTDLMDTTGPDIEIYFDNTNFRSGDVVPPSTTLRVRLYDESGINTSTLGIGHRLTATLTNPATTIDLTEYYASDRDTYQAGEAQYTLNNLPAGKNSLSVRAWDVHNNSAEAKVYFEVVQGTDNTVSHLFAYPNPFARTTYFTFQRTTDIPVNVEIKIFTVAGRMIRRIEVPVVTERFVKIPWDGRDAEGDEVANGVYFYKLITRINETQETKEYNGKIVRVR